MKLPSPTSPPPRAPPPAAVHRRQLLAYGLTSLLLAPARRALALPFGLGGGAGGGVNPSEEVLSRPDLCQARPIDQDFVVVRYVGRFADGTPFDTRYADRDLVYELGAFYLPGVDELLVGRCVGTKLRLRWESCPAPVAAADAALLPAGSAISLEIELRSIKYSLFGEKMRNASSTYWFNPERLTLASAPDGRGHASSRTPFLPKDNPFAISPSEISIISNPSGLLKPLLSGQLPDNPFTGDDPVKIP